MFGYVKPYVPEMKVSHYEKYRAAYCGLCRSMGKVTGQLSRLTLSYDFVFLAAVRMILCGIEPEFEPMRCLAHPVKKRLVMKNNDALEFTASIAAILVWAKNKDDFSDERGAERIKPILVAPFAEYLNRRGGKTLPEKTAETACEMLAKLTELERACCSSADEAASVFGETLGYIFSLGLDGERSDIARRIGYSVGKFIYMCDAADDMESDIKRKRYNPLYIGWGELALGDDGRMSDLVKESVMTAVPIELEALDAAVVQLDKIAGEHVMFPIVKNIVYLGLTQSMQRILYKDGEIKREEFF